MTRHRIRPPATSELNGPRSPASRRFVLDAQSATPRVLPQHLPLHSWRKPANRRQPKRFVEAARRSSQRARYRPVRQ
ncbi:hypothetical protein C7S13_0639 [Burkholderia cepacia]|nr:hypothetical protein [Burkholderia cepacia]QOH32596.1 hypothetical protein C7S14_7093 [Burkholderia cepacia]